MKLDELIEAATNYQKKGGATNGYDLAQGVIDLLGEAQPCGFPEPIVQPNGSVGIPDEWAHGWVSAEEARALARMLFHAADEAESTNATGT